MSSWLKPALPFAVALAAAVPAMVLGYLLYGGAEPSPRRPPPGLPPPFDGDPPHLAGPAPEALARRTQRAGAWTIVRGRLLEGGEADAVAWAAQLDPLILALRPGPDGAAVDEPQALEAKLLAEIAAMPAWMAIPGVSPQVARIRGLRQ